MGNSSDDPRKPVAGSGQRHSCQYFKLAVRLGLPKVDRNSVQPSPHPASGHSGVELWLDERGCPMSVPPPAGQSESGANRHDVVYVRVAGDHPQDPSVSALAADSSIQCRKADRGGGAAHPNRTQKECRRGSVAQRNMITVRSYSNAGEEPRTYACP